MAKTINYNVVETFTKWADLRPWFKANLSSFMSLSTESYKRAKEFYARPRKVELKLRIRYERSRDGRKKVIGKIDCPINPLPIRGEFEIATLNGMENFLIKEGWSYQSSELSHWFEEPET